MTNVLLCGPVRRIIIYKLTLSALNVIVLQLTGGLTTLVIFCNLYYDFPALLCLHAVLTTIGLVIFVTEAIGLATTREYFKLLTRHENLVIHAALMSIGMVLIVVGIGLAMFDKFSRQESVFSGMHTVTGMIATLLLLVALTIGYSIIVLRSDVRVDFARRIVLKWLELPHNVCYALGYGIGMSSLCYGFGASIKFTAQVSQGIKVCCIAMSLIIVCWTMVCSFYDLLRILEDIVTWYDVTVNRSTKIDMQSTQSTQTTLSDRSVQS